MIDVEKEVEETLDKGIPEVMKDDLAEQVTKKRQLRFRRIKLRKRKFMM